MASNKPTDNSRLAETVTELIRRRIDETITLTFAGNQCVRQGIYRRLTKEERAKIVISIRDEKMIVSICSLPKHQKLETLLKEALPYIDDDDLYDRIWLAAYGGHSEIRGE